MVWSPLSRPGQPHCEDLAWLMTLETGRPLAESRAEVDYGARYFRWYAEEAVRVGGRTTTADDGRGRITTVKVPVGPCLFVTPWNFPLAMGARKIAAALAAGCTCVVKPAAQTPLTMLALAQILDEAGAPPGTVNVVCTSRPADVIGSIIADPRLRKLSFTGSTAVGKLLARQATEQLLRVSMELGGNAPFLVLADADLDAAVRGALVAKMRNGGQACTSANRFYVHESLAEAFIERLTGSMLELTTGRGCDPAAQVGPLIDATQRSASASPLWWTTPSRAARECAVVQKCPMEGATSTRLLCSTRSPAGHGCCARRSSGRSPRS